MSPTPNALRARARRRALEADDSAAFVAATGNPWSPFHVALCIRYRAVRCMRAMVDDPLGEGQCRVDDFIAGILRSREDSAQEDMHAFMVECLRQGDDRLFGLFIRSREMTSLKWALYMDIIAEAAVELAEGIVDELTMSPVFLESLRYNLMELPGNPDLIHELMDSVMSIAMGDRTTEAYLRRLRRYYDILEYKAIILQYIGHRIVRDKEPLFRLYQYAWCRPETIVFLLEKITDLAYPQADVLSLLEWQRLCVKGPLCVWKLCALTDIGARHMMRLDKSRWAPERRAFLEHRRGKGNEMRLPAMTDLAFSKANASALWTSTLKRTDRAESLHLALKEPVTITYDKTKHQLIATPKTRPAATLFEYDKENQVIVTRPLVC